MAQEVLRVSQVRALSSSLMQYLWELIFPALPSAVGDVGEALSLRTRRFNLPGFEIQKVFSHFKGHRIPHPSKPQFSSEMTVGLEEGTDVVVLSSMRAWREVWLNEETGVGGLESDLKITLRANLLDNEKKIVKSIDIYDVFPQSVPGTALAFESPELVVPEITLAYSWWDFV
jgi:hypothetical protein